MPDKPFNALSGLEFIVQRLAATVFNIGLPRSANLFNYAIRQAGVIQVVRLFSPGFVSPVEELQHFCALFWFLLIFVDQNERGRGNRPRIFAFLVGQILSEGFAPVCTFAALAKFSSVGKTGLPSAEISLVYARLFCFA